MAACTFAYVSQRFGGSVQPGFRPFRKFRGRHDVNGRRHQEPVDVDTERGSEAVET